MATIMALAAVAITGLAALRGEKRSLAIFALVGVFLGIAVSSVAAVIGVGFDTLAPHYNLWLPHGVLLAGAVAFGVPTARNARFAMLAALAADLLILRPTITFLSRLARQLGNGWLHQMEPGQ